MQGETPIGATVVCGGRWHDFDYARLRILTELGRHERVRTRVFEDYDCHDALATSDLLISYTCDVRPTESQQEMLADFVARGGRWLALHATNSAIDPPSDDGPRIFRTPRVLGKVAEVLGSQFLAHPKIAPYRVEVAEPGHPLVSGIEPFEVSDELYVSELHGPLEVLLHTRFSGECPGFEEGHHDGAEVRPVLYLKRHGAGEVCYCTLGHCRGRFDVRDLGVTDTGVVDRGSWEVPEFGTVFARCVEWAAYGEVSA